MNMKMITYFILLLLTIIFFTGCAVSLSHKVAYPPANDLFVTLGDDPGSESQKPYTPNGQFIHVEQEAYLPLPILGIFVKMGNANPQYVFDKKVIPQVRQMGGDALIGATVSYTPSSPWWFGLIGLR